MLKLIFCTFVLLTIIFFGTSKAEEEQQEKSVYCYYDSRSFYRQDNGKVKLAQIEPALEYCTDLIYGYAGISSINYKMIPLNPNLDLEGHSDYYSAATKLKKKFPNLNVYLSVGGGADLDKSEKYLTLLESTEARKNFIDSACKILEDYNFDGIDLAWQFPADEIKKSRGVLGSVWHGIKSTFSKKHSIDEKHVEHREQFVKLVHELGLEIGTKKVLVSVLPNVNSTMFFDYLPLVFNTHKIILHTYDFYTPDRYKKVGDHTSPIHAIEGRFPEMNIEAIVNNWIVSEDIPPSNIILGIPTFGRSWETDHECDPSGIPPVRTNGPGPRGPFTQKNGLLAYYEICKEIIEDETTDVNVLARFSDETKKCGPYAFNMKYKNNDFGIWVSYEDPSDIGNKIEFWKAKHLAGIAIVDLSLDDFGGICTGEKFPLLKAAVTNMKA